MEILSTSPGEKGPQAFIELWNACIGEQHPLAPALWEQHLSHPTFDPALFFVAKEGDELLGFVAGAAPELVWSPPDLGFLSYLAVRPEARRRGIGGQLYEAVRTALAARGRQRLRLAGDPNHLLPGMPAGASADTWRFFVKRGLRPSSVVHDLHLDLSLPLPEPALAANLRLCTDNPEGVLGFLERVFPGRWRDEAKEYLQGGAPLLSLEQQGEVVGFACVFPPDCPVLGPSRHWRGALPGRVAGLGPIGLDPVLRGQGQGLAFFVAASGWLRAQGAAHLIVNWTELTGFYGRAGGRVWRSYQRMDGEL